MREALEQVLDHAFGRARPAPHRGEHPARQRAVDRVGPRRGVPPGGLLAALPADRRPVARPRALRDHRRRARGGQGRPGRLEQPELFRVGRPAGRARAPARARRARAPVPARAAPARAAPATAGIRAKSVAQRRQHRRRVERRGGVEAAGTAAPARPERPLVLRPCRRVMPVGSSRSSFVAKFPSVHTTLRLDQLELPEQVVLAGVDLLRQRVAVAGRPALEDVAPRTRRRGSGRSRRAAVSSSRPAWPTNGRPCLSSLAPGASPTNIRSASALPEPNTTVVRVDASCGQRRQARRLLPDGLELLAPLRSAGHGAKVPPRTAESGRLPRILRG